ncbi:MULTISPECIES: hypothetical protein [Salimicrobium]|uniref:Small integral membrane protein n=1 Tax=Salimicrobium salexigens TaxID=908941 RepID=A0ABY1KKU6_9BACI|nr:MULTISPECIES: hypothetical protein [Salimicrobium]MBM7696815.1 membrane associated rhomboid family serine protease [Salimicrobium jeotgali]SIS46480.1 hypothetical protein SAMN05421758_101298 [Salimicrobium salexigens]
MIFFYILMAAFVGLITLGWRGAILGFVIGIVYAVVEINAKKITRLEEEVRRLKQGSRE